LNALGSHVTAELISVPISLIRVGHMGWGWRRRRGTEKKELPLFSDGNCFISEIVL